MSQKPGADLEHKMSANDSSQNRTAPPQDQAWVLREGVRPDGTGDIEALVRLLNPPDVTCRRCFWTAKRTVDVVTALIALVLLAPALLVLAAAIKLDSPGPVLFVQERVGRRLRLFRILKFRTMHVGASKTLPIWDEALATYRRPTLGEDVRLTRIGRLLRRWSLDELPQLVNILLGEMSLVGPRPLSLDESTALPMQALARYAVPAGLTGLDQIRTRDLVFARERIENDLEYVRTLSSSLELRILLATFGEVLRYARANPEKRVRR